jgi:hypothetical protein
MSEDLGEESGEAAASVTRVQVRADAFVYEGLVTLLPDNDRLQAVLNDPHPFLSMTEVTVFDASTGSTYSTPYLALNKGAITHVVLVAEGLTEGVQSSVAEGPDAAPPSAEPAVAAPTLPPQPLPESLISRPPAPPPAAPLPKIPVPLRNDSATQPFPGLDDELSDLILDDDGDDIDPDDLLGASGDHKTRSLGD